MALETPADRGEARAPQGRRSRGLTLFSRRVGSRSAWILAVCCVAQFMVILDLSIVNVALPSIQTALNFSSPELQWVVDAYAITFAGFLMLGGRAADRLGPPPRVRHLRCCSSRSRRWPAASRPTATC